MKNRELFTFIRHAVNRASGSDEMIDAALDFLHQLQYDYNTRLLESEEPASEQEEESSPEEPESEQEEEPSPEEPELEQEEYDPCFDPCFDSEFDELVITAEEGTTVFHINPDSFSISEALEAIEDYPEEVVVSSDQSSDHGICVFCEGSNSYYWLCDVECLLDYDIESCQFMYKIYDSLDERSWLCTVFGSYSSFHTRSGHFCISACSDCFLDSFNFFIAQACVFSHSSDLHPH